MAQPQLPRTGILAYMDDESREVFASYGSWMTTAAGDVLIQEGAVNQHLFIIVSGTFNVSTQIQGQDVGLDTVGPGDCLGEVAVFSPDQASATVTSIDDGQLWVIDVESLQQFLLDYPASGCAAVLGIDVLLTRRLRQATNVIRTHAIVPGFLSVRAMARANR